MKQLLMMLLVGLFFSGQALGAGKNGVYWVQGASDCGEYLGAYAKTELTGTNDISGPHRIHNIVGWISGYQSAYNKLVPNGKDAFFTSWRH